MRYNLGVKINASKTDIAIGAFIDTERRLKNVSQQDIANKLGRSAQSYVSDRINGKKSWLIGDLDIIAPMLGLPDALSLVASALGRYKTN